MKFTPISFLSYLGLGALVGTVSGLFGVGGGIVMVPALVLLAGQSQHMAQGISLAAMVPAAAAGALRYWKGGNVDIPLAFAVALGAIPAAYLFGANLAQKLPDRSLKILFAMLMVVAATRIMPSGSTKSMGLLLGATFIAVGVRMVMAR